MCLTLARLFHVRSLALLSPDYQLPRKEPSNPWPERKIQGARPRAASLTAHLPNTAERPRVS